MHEMSDRQAVQLLELINEYAAMSAEHNMPIEEVSALTLKEVAEDLVGSLPAAQTVDLPWRIARMVGD